MTDYTLRPYQRDLKAAYHAATTRAPLIVLPTGGGKTIVACSIIEDHLRESHRVLFLAHRRELIEQCSAKLDEIGIRNHGVILAGHWRQAPHLPVQVASIPTLARRLDKPNGINPADFDLIVIDEAHHARAATYHKVIDQAPNARLIGLTATPYRQDGRPLADMFTELVQGPSIGELIEYGALVQPVTIGTSKRLNLQSIKTKRGDYDVAELAERMDRDALVGDLAKEYQRHAAGTTAVVFAVNVQHSKHIVERFQSIGIAAEHLDGETPEDERKGVLARLANGETQIVSNCQLLTEGWDCPRVSTIILARPTKSRALWRQMVGRALRPYPGKTECLILDHACNHLEHGYPEHPDDVSLTAGLKPPAPTVEWNCPKCRSVLVGRPSRCPYCLADIRRKAQDVPDFIPPVEIDMPMERLRPVPAATRNGDLYQELAEEAARKGYKPGWIVMQFKARVGRFPTKTERARGETIAVKAAEVALSQARDKFWIQLEMPEVSK